MALIYCAISEILGDDPNDEGPRTVSASHASLMAAHLAHERDAELATACQQIRGKATAATAAAAPPLNKRAERVRWLAGLRRTAPRGYMRAGMTDDDADALGDASTKFEIGGDSDDDEAVDEEVHLDSNGLGHFGRPQQPQPSQPPLVDLGSTASFALSVHADVPAGAGASLRLSTLNTASGGVDINVPLPAGTVAHQSIRFQLLPSQLAALHPEDVRALREGRFVVARVD